jgi:outer membrane receptor protein involved in Fe transport
MASTITTRSIGLIMALGLGGMADAQQAGGSNGATPYGDSLETVVVTADRRSEQIKDVPASVSAITGAEIEERQIQGVEDISRTVPGLSFGAGGNPGMDTITMRGVSSQGGNATVGQYLDDVPIVTQSSFAPPSPTSGAAEPKLFDLDRVEVLRGPQGTLYGAGSMGGTLRYITNAPNPNQFSAATTDEVSYTAHGGTNFEGNGVVNIPLVPGVLALRAGADVEWLSGYIDRYHQMPLTEADVLANDYQAEPTTLENTRINGQRTLAARIAVEWLATEHLSITPALFTQRYSADDSSVFTPDLGRYVQDNLIPQPTTDTMMVPSLTVRGDFGWADLTSVSSYFFRQNAHTTDGTYFNSDFIQYLADTSPDLGACQCGVAFANLGSPSLSGEQTQTTSEELRLASKLPAESGIPLTWLVGIFASDRVIHTYENDFIPGIRQTFLNLYGVPPQDTSFADPFNGDLAGWSLGKETQAQIAGFGEVTWYALPSLRLTAGLRELRATTNFRWDTGGYFAQGIAPVTTGSNGYNAATPKFSISGDIASNATLYATASKGYRIGGYVPPIDLTTGTCPASLAAFGITNPKFSYDPDSLWSYEIGAKTNWLQNRLSVNASTYYVDWKKVQQTFSLACGSAYTANFGDAESYGGELEVLAKPLHGWTVGVEGGVTHASLTSVVPNVGAVEGERLLNVPSYTATVSSEYRWKISSGASTFIRGDYDWIGPSHGSYNMADPAYLYPSYTLFNASGGYTFGNITLSLFSKNLLNDQRIIQRVTIELLENAYVPRPRTVGVQFRAAL